METVKIRFSLPIVEIPCTVAFREYMKEANEAKLMSNYKCSGSQHKNMKGIRGSE